MAENGIGIVQSGIGQLDIAYSKLQFKLSWTHYQILMRIENKDERDLYDALVDLTLSEDANIYAKGYELYLPDKKILQ